MVKIPVREELRAVLKTSHDLFSNPDAWGRGGPWSYDCFHKVSSFYKMACVG
jgi:hypothetical protein